MTSGRKWAGRYNSCDQYLDDRYDPLRSELLPTHAPGHVKLGSLVEIDHEFRGFRIGAERSGFDMVRAGRVEHRDRPVEDVLIDFSRAEQSDVLQRLDPVEHRLRTRMAVSYRASSALLIAAQ